MGATAAGSWTVFREWHGVDSHLQSRHDFLARTFFLRSRGNKSECAHLADARELLRLWSHVLAPDHSLLSHQTKALDNRTDMGNYRCQYRDVHPRDGTQLLYDHFMVFGI